jgi:hypothetical protein
MRENDQDFAVALAFRYNGADTSAREDIAMMALMLPFASLQCSKNLPRTA